MALFVRQNEERSKLQEKLAAELQERQKQRQVGDAAPKKVDDYAYLEGTKDASSLTWVWIIIFLVIAGLIIYFMYQGATR